MVGSIQSSCMEEFNFEETALENIAVGIFGSIVCNSRVGYIEK